MRRRSFLASAVASSAFGALPLSRLSAGSRVLSAAVIITDISANTNAASLLSAAQHLVEQGVWITCAIRLDGSDKEIRELAGLLQSLAEIGSGIDLAIELPELARLSPYFQARSVFEARERLKLVLRNAKSLAIPQSVLCHEIEGPAEPTGVRASGISTVLVRPKATSVVRSEAWDDGVVRFFGGQLASPLSNLDAPVSGAAAESTLIYYVSANDLHRVPEEHLADWTAGFGKTLLEREMNGQLSLMTVSDLQLRDDFKKRRPVVVLLELSETATPAERDVVAVFRKNLASMGIPTAVRPDGDFLWVERQSDNGVIVSVTVLCTEQSPSRITAPSKVGPGYVLSLTDDPNQTPGIDGCAILRQPITRINPEISASRTASQTEGAQDRMLILSAEQIATPEARQRVLFDLQALRGDGITEFVSIADFAAELHTNEPVAVRHRLTRAAFANPMSHPKNGLDDAERTRLLDDARHAWGYIQKYQEPATGLCPATVETMPGGDVQQSVTMWDVGSNLNAIVAAVELGLIERKKAQVIFERILPNIAGRKTDGRQLPQGWIRTDRHRWGNRDFDGSDGGRLLASLDNMRRRFGMGDTIGKLVNSWDLDKIVVGGEIHSVINRKLSSTYLSHCAHYAALSLRRWGLNPASPYETFADRASGDGEIALLETVARIGPLGTEPLLLEAMELGMSSESAYLADVLLAAMEEEYAVNNRLICVSESPIDREPWFIYQGLELGSGHRSWRMDTVGHHPEYMTAEMANELMTFSTKAAFLWAAYRPGDFTSTLLDFARQNGRADVGFISGVNVKTQRRMAHYTDLNTNSIILQSVAHMLRASG